MKNKVISMIISGAMLLSAAVPAAAADTADVEQVLGNLIANGTFEENTSPWSVSDGLNKSLENDGCYSSAKSMKLTGAGTATAKMSVMYPQETYKMSAGVKAVSDTVTVTLKYNYASKGETAIISKTIAPQDGWTEVSGLFKWHDGTSYSYKGAEVKNGGGTVSVEVSGDCLIDEVLVKPSDEKIINAAGTDNFGGWMLRDTTNAAALVYDEADGAIYGKKLQKTNAAILYPVALEKGAEYKLSAKVKKDSDTTAEKANVYFGSTGDVTQIDVSADEWTDVTINYTSAYPKNAADGVYAGTIIAFSGLGSLDNQIANLKVKDVSVKRTGTETAQPTAALESSESEILSGTAFEPSVTLSDAAGARYVYKLNGNTAASGVISSDEILPSYTPSANGTLKISVTPFNAGGYGETKEISVKVKGTEDPNPTPVPAENKGVESPDKALGNLIANGTFENGIPQNWKYTGVTASREIVNTAENSVGAMKLTGNGTAVIEDISMYYNEVYDVSLKVKSASDTPVTASLSADVGGYSKKLGEVTASADNWSDITAQLSRYVTTYKNVAEKSISGMLTLEVSGDCYIDEFILKPSEELLLSKDGVRIGTADEGLKAEKCGWIQRGEAQLTYDEENAALKAAGLKLSDTAAAQYVALKKGSAYKLTAQVKAVDKTQNTKAKIYAFYTGITKNITLTDNWTDISLDIPAEKTAAVNIEGDKIASAVIFGSQSGSVTADMYIRNASLKEVVSEAAVPEITKAVIPSSALCGNEVTAEVEADFSKTDAVGFKYVYKLNGVPVKAGYAAKQSEIEPYKIPADTASGSLITLAVIPMNVQGVCGTAKVSEVCSVVSAYSVEDAHLEGSIAAGASVTANVKIKNNTSADADTAVVAVYFENKVLKACGAERKIISAGNESTFTPNITLPQNLNKGEIKVFVWKDGGGVFPMCPIGEPITIN